MTLTLPSGEVVHTDARARFLGDVTGTGLPRQGIALDVSVLSVDDQVPASLLSSFRAFARESQTWREAPADALRRGGGGAGEEWLDRRAEPAGRTATTQGWGQPLTVLPCGCGRGPR